MDLLPNGFSIANSIVPLNFLDKIGDNLKKKY